MSEPGYSRDGDLVTLTMTEGDYDMLLLRLGVAAATIRRGGGDAMFWATIALVNRINAGNPNFEPYEIPKSALAN